MMWLADSVKKPPVVLSESKSERHSPQSERVDIERLQLSDNVIFTIADDAYFDKASVLIDSVNKFDLEFITELCTAIKPSMFEWCFSKGAKRVLYIDPDCELYGSIDYLFEQLIDNECILFPHFLDASALDRARSPDIWDKRHDALALRVGVYNCGMIGFSLTENTNGLIKWWGQRILYESECSHDNFTFTDQSWGSLMPGLAKTKIVRSPEYNVAWWNFHERDITYDDGCKINGNPLKVYHFSGYETEKPLIFSRHHRGELPEQCQRLFLDYSKKLISANDINLCGYG